MSAEIVNLRTARKAKARADRERKADENRQLYGRTATQKKREAAEREQAERHVAQHRLEQDED